jgi:hypothetical protein
MDLELQHMTIMTLARSREVGIVPPAQAVFLAILYTNGTTQEAVGFCTLIRIADFIDDMNPGSVSIEGASGEDSQPLSEFIFGSGSRALN